MSSGTAIPLTWEDPPPPKRGNRATANRVPPNSYYVGVVRALRGQPSRWARIGEWDSLRGTDAERARIQRGAEPAFWPVHEFELAISARRLYVRYIGCGTGEDS